MNRSTVMSITVLLVAASAGRGQDADALAKLSTWEAKIKRIHQELDAYHNTPAQGESQQLRRSDRFYPIHLRAMVRSIAAAHSSQQIAPEDLRYLERGMAALNVKHREIKQLLDALKVATNDTQRSQIISKLKPLYRMQIFSAIGGKGRIPIESVTAKPLPKGGVIEPKKKGGKYLLEKEMDPEQLKKARAADCSCRTVTLARVVVKQHKPREGVKFAGNIGKRNVKTVYDIWDSSNPPHTGPLTIPVLKYGEDLCLYFTYPEETAYLVPERRDKLCNVKVEVQFPWNKSRTGVQSHVWQLYSVTGTLGGNAPIDGAGIEGRKVVKNEVVIRVWPKGCEIGPSGKKGHIRWSFRRPTEMKGGFARKICDKVPFTVQ